ncbi:MAG: TIGR02281 family clan AA aspartic protease [Sphingopyxis sp.]|uniref:retropepsin-like aspartic protease family protein n=1 Tax=Sphingopyxis sp. TaxID=1908224 RepID=UPI002ABA9A49|nr:TIGR02281 family clan AA aspartic protease [Sphingopyxis sp.]MDZ3832546.1 TIGR02281 family clan AA aspartic protease [Sphingopyxis sp.]
MIGRFLGLAALIAALSVGMAHLAGRTADTGGRETVSATTENHDNWTKPSSRQDRPSSQTMRSGEVRLGRAADSHFYADADVDGTRVRMLVDSGASIVALTRGDAEAIGIDVDRLPVGGRASTAGGVVPLRPVMIDRIDIDGVEVRRVQAAVIDADMGVSLLGQSYLSRLDAVEVEGDTMTLR